jgi:hypothetical protein
VILGIFVVSLYVLKLVNHESTSAHQHISKSAHQHISTSAHQHISTSFNRHFPFPPDALRI